MGAWASTLWPRAASIALPPSGRRWLSWWTFPAALAAPLAPLARLRAASAHAHASTSASASSSSGTAAVAAATPGVPSQHEDTANDAVEVPEGQGASCGAAAVPVVQRGSEFTFVCDCFYWRNYFAKEVGLHVDYAGRDAFVGSEEGRALLGELSAPQQERVLAELETERQRRLGYFEAAVERAALIRQYYTPLHPEVYSLQDAWVDPKLRELAAEAAAAVTGAGSASAGKAAAYARDLRAQLRQRPAGVYASLSGGKVAIHRLPVFTPAFCALLSAELLHFHASSMPKARPNSMNNYGFLLEELGFYPNLLNPMLERYIHPLAAVLYPDEGGGTLDYHRTFVVRYAEGEDVELAYHYDDAEVTLNVSLGVDFEGGEVLFGAVREAPPASHHLRHAHDHKVGVGLLHRGRHMHEAAPLEEGLRLNLIMWCRSKAVREAKCPTCGEAAIPAPVAQPT